MVEKVWLAEYPEGVPAEIDLDQYSSLKEMIETNCAKFKDLPAYSCMGKTITYGELDELSERFGAYLQKTAGLNKGDRVAIMMPNVLQYPVAAFGILRAGMVVVNTNPLYTPRELEHQLTDSGAKAIVILENFATTLEKVISQSNLSTVIVTGIGDLLSFPKSTISNFVVRRVKKMVPSWNIEGTISFKRAIHEGKWQTLEALDVDKTDTAFLQYTGGTTGVAKGAVLSHGNMVANMLQSAAWLSPVIRSGQEVVITALPLYHIFSLTANCLTFLGMGGHNVLIANPRDFAGFVAELRRYSWTTITGVNTLFNALLNTPGFSSIDFSNVKLSLGGGMAVQRNVAEKWQKVTQAPLIEAYGLTETSPAAAINPITNTVYNGSIGLPISSTEFSIRNDAGEVLPQGEVGEICIRGPQVMQGYWQRPEETDKVMLEDGWLRTGDIGRMDEKGYFFIEDRKKDMILVSGFNVYPNEIEEVVTSHPGVLEAAAVGIPHPKSGEMVKVFAVRKDTNLTEQVLIQYCKEQLTAYKVPKSIEFREDLPKSNVGKILRRELRDEEIKK